MTTKYIFLLSSLLALNLSACTDIQDGTTDIDSWPEVNKYELKHPCMLHTADDFTFVKGKVAEGASPWKEAFTKLEANSYAQSSYVASPVETLKRLDPTNWGAIHPDHSNYTNLMRDAAAAYQLGLRWRISGDEQYAKACIKILNAWATTCKGFVVNNNGAFIDPNENLVAIQVHQLANAAEALRDYPGWAVADFKKFQIWISDVFYKHASNFLLSHSTAQYPLHYWLNWDLAQMTAILSIGILNDDQNKINEVIQYFKYGKGAGCIYNAIPFMHDDPDSSEKIAQCQESGRDQGHATLCVSLMGSLCQMAYNIGEDLFAFDNNRVLAMTEYVGKYNLLKEGVNSTTGADADFVYSRNGFPYTLYNNGEGDYPTLSYDETRKGNGEVSRGTQRPGWDLIYNHYAKVKGVSTIYSKEFADRMRPDGGGGHYGPNSGGFDQLGFSTLMFTK